MGLAQGFASCRGGMASSASLVALPFEQFAFSEGPSLAACLQRVPLSSLTLGYEQGKPPLTPLGQGLLFRIPLKEALLAHFEGPCSPATP